MKKTFISLVVIFLIIISPKSAMAKLPSTGWTGQGLYLLQDNKIQLNTIDINITINENQQAQVEAQYELINKEDKTINVFMGVPEHQISFESFSSKVLPYRYGNKKSNGANINKEVAGDIKVNFDNWRTWYAPFKAGEKRIVELNYSVDNKYISDGKYLISYRMEGIKSWMGNPKEVTMKVNFSDKDIKVYNFGSEYSIKPELEDNYSLKWNFKNFNGDESIDFDYYSVDYEIMKFLGTIQSAKINNIRKAYENKDYNNVIKLSKEYLEGSESPEFQREIYFLLADAYEKTGQAEESLIIYELIQGELGFYEGLQEKIKQVTTYNKIKNYLQLEDYKSLYNITMEVKRDKNYSFIYKGWAEDKRNQIPQEERDRIIEELREPEGFEKIMKNFMDGVYNLYIIIFIGVVILIISFLNIKKKRKDSKRLKFRKGKR